MALDALIFDLDGTLIDTNAMHVEAWCRAFERHGYRIGADRVFFEIGKGGDKVVPALLGEELDRKDGDALRKAQPEEFAAISKQNTIKVFPGVRDLFAALHQRGLKTVLATSSNAKQLKASEEASGLKVKDLVDYLVTVDDAGQSKPSPDLVAASVKKLGMTPAQCAMVGDTPYDAEAAKRAGVILIGLTCGGHPIDRLRAAGARLTYKDPADLLDHLDEALHGVSPGSAHLTQKVLEGLMREALSAAKEGMAAGEVPIGCALSRGDGIVIAHGYNELNRSKNKTAHAEIVTFARCAGKVPVEARDLILVSTLEPCVMCVGASMEASVDTIVFGLKAPADSGATRVSPPQSPESQMPRIVPDVMADESRALFKQWLDKPGNHPQQIQFVKQLLALTKD